MDADKQGLDDSMHGRTPLAKRMPAALLVQLQTCQGTFSRCALQNDARNSTMISVIIIVSYQFAMTDMIKVVQQGCRTCQRTYRQTMWSRSETAHLEHEVIGAKASEAADHTHSAL